MEEIHAAKDSTHDPTQKEEATPSSLLIFPRKRGFVAGFRGFYCFRLLRSKMLCSVGNSFWHG
jgi:hypothetical protein